MTCEGALDAFSVNVVVPCALLVVAALKTVAHHRRLCRYPRGVVPIASLYGAPVPADPRTAELAQRFWPEG